MADFDFLNTGSTESWQGFGTPTTPNAPTPKFQSKYLNNLDNQEYDFMNIGDGTNMNMPTIPNIGGADAWNPSQWDKAMGYTNPMTGAKSGGYVSPMLGLAQGAMQTWLGLKELNLAEDQLDFDRHAFSKNFDAQKTTTNAELASRQKRAGDRNINNKDLFSARVK